MSKPPITVLMTVYNGGEYLKSSVNSVLKQTFRDFELLIIDDCSTDRTLEDIQKIKDSRIRIHHNENNLGQTRSLNVGLELARGEYVGRMDADDIIYPQWLEIQHNFITIHPQYCAVSTKAAVINSRSKLVKVLHSPESWDEILLKFLTDSPINHVGVLMNKEVVRQVGGYDASFKIAADYDLWSKLIRNGHRLASTPHVLAAIRVHESSTSILEKGKSDIQELPKIMRQNIEYLTKGQIDKKDVVLIWKLIYDTVNLDEGEFKEAQKNIFTVYESIRPSIGIRQENIKKFARNQKKIFYIKRLFAFIDRDVYAARKLAKEYIRENGLFNFFILIWIFSFFGRMALSRLPLFYGFLRKLSAIFLNKQKVHS